ncbi:MAG: MBL fold metallo-hydrolase [Candidatus Micrarchaeia archaeon]
MASGHMIAATRHGFRLSLDTLGGDYCFISHAHSDHSSAARARDARIIASPETAALLGYGGALHSVEGAQMHNAGHILGSTQLLIDTPEGRLLYTGDLKTEDSLTAKGASPVECDTLVVEGTFANPSVKFQKREEIYLQIADWVGKSSRDGITVLGGYALGKSQELIKVLNDMCGITPVVPQSVMRFCTVYNRFGAGLECVLSTSPEGQQIMEGDFVAVIPQSHVTRVFAKKMSQVHNAQVRTAIATGWAAIRQFDTDASFALSDHADFESLLSYVRATGAKKVYCVHGNEHRFAAEIGKRLGIEAIAHYPRTRRVETARARARRKTAEREEGNGQ